MPIKTIEEDFSQAEAILKDAIYEEKLDKNDETDLRIYKLLKARDKNPDFEIELARFICGEEGNSFPYRSSYFLTQFFQNLGYGYSHDGTTRRFWVRDVLKEMSIKDIGRIIQKGLFNKRYFKKYGRKEQEYAPKEAYSKSIEEFKKFIDDSFELNKEIDMGILLDLNVNSDLLFNTKIYTEDDEFNQLISEARERFINSKDKQVAIEKLWDAFERLKTYFSSDKKSSAEKLVQISSGDFDEQIIDQEFRKLTDIGNNYRIRHHETNKKEITDDRNLNYLFFRMLNLLELCAESIQNHDEEN